MLWSMRMSEVLVLMKEKTAKEKHDIKLPLFMVVVSK